MIWLLVEEESKATTFFFFLEAKTPFLKLLLQSIGAPHLLTEKQVANLSSPLQMNQSSFQVQRIRELYMRSGLVDTKI
jgi:hypothetical protein